MDSKNNKNPENNRCCMPLSADSILSDTIVACAQILCSSDESLQGTAILEVLKRIGNDLCSDRVYIFQIDRDTINNTFEWCTEGIPPRREQLQALPLSQLDPCQELFQIHQSIVLDDLNLLKDKYPTNYFALQTEGVHSLIVVPLWIENQLLGFLGIDNYQPEAHNISIGLLTTVSYLIASTLWRQKAILSLNVMNYYDTLTGLRNRNSYIQDAKSGFTFPIGVIYLDMNGLRQVNDQFGHQRGDELLVKMAETVLSVFPEDFCYRMGGDEYVVLCESIDRSRFNDKVNFLNQLFAAQTDYSASVGIYWTDQEDSLENILEAAYDLMYRDKKDFYRRHSAIERYRQITDTMLDFQTPDRLAALIARGDFSVYFQPRFSSQARALVGAEALVRFRKSNGKWETPQQIIDIMEKSQLIYLIDYYVFNTVCSLLQTWNSRNMLVVPISINFSKISLQRDDFLSFILNTLERYNIPRSLIELEITETLDHEGNPGFFHTLHQLKEQNIRIAIDDFGIRNSDLKFFIDIDFNTLKIDKVITRRLYSSLKARRFLSAITQICRDMDILITVEGVETEEELAVIQGLHCNNVQGFLLSKPLPEKDFSAEYLSTAGTI